MEEYSFPFESLNGVSFMDQDHFLLECPFSDASKINEYRGCDYLLRCCIIGKGNENAVLVSPSASYSIKQVLITSTCLMANSKSKEIENIFDCYFECREESTVNFDNIPEIMKSSIYHRQQLPAGHEKIVTISSNYLFLDTKRFKTSPSMYR
ncbi:hypothetical protein DI09_4p530 [Mitosporidium daphniae]|uniref:Uncharacterized protein n=1 Tax=Mitosporidium daphniae TaxID=1485682 RepID=A0A098VPT5_9MICR|nr:uncharacterized protein DI09_4p530 [Mitosporidium daphniae]KGG50970.1 hypothetical protein DI09_4p530 [Mitosporidium daphniae]|eukprot:XP_013237397.1 uncharacterized protein DI09_4p530 [Mitosporidium daphniae]